MNRKPLLVLTAVLAAASGATAVAGPDGHAGDSASGRTQIAQDDLERFISAADRNSDGMLTLDELVEDMGESRTCLPQHMILEEHRDTSSRAPPGLQADFEAADRNGDGRLDIGELEHAVQEPAVLLRGR